MQKRVIRMYCQSLLYEIDLTIGETSNIMKSTKLNSMEIDSLFVNKLENCTEIGGNSGICSGTLHLLMSTLVSCFHDNSTEESIE